MAHRENRRSLRLPVRIPVHAHAGVGAGLVTLEGTLLNIGADGACVVFRDDRLAVGALVTLVLVTKVGPLSIECRVAWVKRDPEGYRHGLAFLRPQARDFAINMFLAEYRPRAKPGG